MAEEWDDVTSATDLQEIREQLASPRNRPCITVLTGGLSGHLFKMTKGSALIGRAINAEIRLEDSGMSRNHARIHCDGGRAWLEDLGSRNGTYLNGERVAEQLELKDGDKIQVGRATVLRFGFQDDLDETFHEHLLASALRDGLTKLFNKRYLMDRLDSELKFADRHQTSLSLLMLDLDHFKKVNDTHGHLGGDAVLSMVAEVLTRAVRNEDVVARFGGEEFAIILRAIDIEPAFQLADRLRKRVEKATVEWSGHQLRATVSIGVAGYPSTPDIVPDALVDAADQALYRAKRAGRNRVSR